MGCRHRRGCVYDRYTADVKTSLRLMWLADYLLDHAGQDFGAMLKAWHWLLPSALTVWLVNRFGEFIFVFEDGSVHYLDIGSGTLERIAGSRDHFRELIDQHDNANQWLMAPLVDECVESGLSLDPRQCYAFRVLPVFGGEYKIENVMVSKLHGYVEFAGLVHQQIRDLPDGSQVGIVVTP